MRVSWRWLEHQTRKKVFVFPASNGMIIGLLFLTNYMWSAYDKSQLGDFYRLLVGVMRKMMSGIDCTVPEKASIVFLFCFCHVKELFHGSTSWNILYIWSHLARQAKQMNHDLCQDITRHLRFCDQNQNTFIVWNIVLNSWVACQPWTYFHFIYLFFKL